MKAQRARLIALLVVVGIFSSCARPDDPSQFLRRETEELQRRTIPPASQVIVRSDPMQIGWSKTAQWEFETNWDWGQYKKWVASKLQPDFQIIRFDGFQLVFARPLQGDTERLTLEAASDGPKLKVKTGFLIYPD